MNKENIYDVIVVGGGPAGSSAAMVLARSSRRTLLLDEGKQRNLLSQGMHNYLTRDGVLPSEYLKLTQEELDKYSNITTVKKRAVEVVQLEDKGFKVSDEDGNHYLCRRLLLATGVTDNIPDIPGMRELWGCSVHHCHYCDGYESCNRITGVYAKKYNGYGLSMALKHICNEVILFTDGAKYLRSKQRIHLEALKIQVISQPLERLVYEETKLTHVALSNGEMIPCESMFVNHGHKVNGDLLQQLECKCTKQGAAVTNRKQETNVRGVYVAGDASIDMHFVVVAAAEGVKAAVAIHNDLLQNANDI